MEQPAAAPQAAGNAAHAARSTASASPVPLSAAALLLCLPPTLPLSPSPACCCCPARRLRNALNGRRVEKGHRALLLQVSAFKADPSYSEFPRCAPTVTGLTCSQAELADLHLRAPRRSARLAPTASAAAASSLCGRRRAPAPGGAMPPALSEAASGKWSAVRADVGPAAVTRTAAASAEIGAPDIETAAPQWTHL